MKFGNWNVTETVIEWAGEGFQRFVIEKQLLVETLQVPDVDELYKWIVLATEEEWLTVDDFYDLNFAFVYAAGSSQQPLNYEIFDKTVEYQFSLLDEEEETEP